MERIKLQRRIGSTLRLAVVAKQIGYELGRALVLGLLVAALYRR